MTTSIRSASIESLCLNVTSGGTPSRRNEEFWANGTIPWVKTGELKDCYIYDTEEKITEAGLLGSSAKVFPINTVLMAMYGDGKTITSLAIVKNEVATNQACCAMITDPAKCNYRYLYYALMHHRHRLLSLVVAGAQRNLSNGIIKRFKISIFPLKTQQKIASILSAYDDLIEDNRRRIQLLEQAARLLYREWFVHLRFPGHEHVTITDGVPEGWEKTTVGSVSSFISRGITPKYNEEAPGIVLNQKCIRNQRVEMGLARRQSKEVMPNKLVRNGDVLINSTGQGTLGRVAQFFSLIENCTVDSHVTIARPCEDLPVQLYGHHIASMEDFLSIMGRGATNQTELSRDTVSEIPFFRPPHLLAEQFEAFAKETSGQVQNLMQQNTMLAKARDLLLPRLMNGEVAV